MRRKTIFKMKNLNCSRGVFEFGFQKIKYQSINIIDKMKVVKLLTLDFIFLQISKWIMLFLLLKYQKTMISNHYFSELKYS